MPAKFERCVKHVKRRIRGRKLPAGSNAYAICTAALKGASKKARENPIPMGHGAVEGVHWKPLLIIIGGALAVGTAIVLAAKPAPAATNPNPNPQGGQGGGGGNPNPTPNPGPTPHPNPNPNPHPTFCEVNFVTSVDGPYSAVVCLNGGVHVRAALDWAIFAMGDASILQFENVAGGMFNWKTIGRGTTTVRLHNQKTDIYQDFTITVP